MTGRTPSPPDHDAERVGDGYVCKACGRRWGLDGGPGMSCPGRGQSSERCPLCGLPFDSDEGHWHPDNGALRTMPKGLPLTGMTRGDNVQASARISTAESEQVDALAEQRGWTRSQALRYLIRVGLAETTPARTPS